MTATPQPDNANATRTDAPAAPGDASRDASSVPAQGATRRAPQPFYDALESVAQGLMLAPVLRKLGVSRDVFYDWLGRDAELKARYTRARDCGFDAVAESLAKDADEPLPEGPEAGTEVARRRLAFDTKRWLLARWSNRYSEKPTGSGGINVSVSIATGVPATGQRITVDATDAAPMAQLEQGDDDASV